MKRWQASALVVLVVGFLMVAPGVVLVQASTLQGQAIDIEGVNSATSTFWTYLKGGVGRTIAAIIGVGGLVKVGNRNENGWTMAGVGAGMGFLPNIITTGFDAAPAATGPLSHAVQQSSHFVVGLTHGQLYLDPLVLACFAGLLVLKAWQRQRQGRRIAM